MTRKRTAFVLAAFALVASACGGHLADAEVRAASSVTEVGGVGADGVGPGGTGVGPAGDAGGGSAPVTQPGGGVGVGAVGGGGAGTVPTSGGGGGDGGGATDGGAPVGGGAGDAAVTTDETGPIVIASVGNYSGPAGGSLVGLPRAVQTWAAAVNSRGGLFGRQVQVIVQDDGGDPARYAAAVRDLVENRGAIAFVANGAPLSMAGGQGYLESNGIPVIGSDCALQAWFTGPVYFPQCTTYNDTIVNLMRAGHDVSGLTRFGYVTCTEAQACTGQAPLFEGGAAAAGVDIVYQGDISLTQVDFTAQCRNAQAAGVELFYVGADANTVARVVRSCDRQGFRPQYIQVGLTALADTKDLSGIGDVIVSLMFFPFAGADTPAAREFYSAYDTFVGAVPDPSDASGWAAAKLFERIATDAARATRSLSPATLLDAARQISGETLGGLTTELDFTAGHATPRNCYFAVQAQGGRWVDVLGEPRCV